VISLIRPLGVAAALLWLSQAAAQTLPTRTLEQVCADIASSGPEAVEGVWRLTAPDDGGALVAVEREAGSPGCYLISIVEAPGRSLRPGTVIGHASRGSERGVYDAWLYTEAPLPGITPRSRRELTMRLSDGGNRLTFTPHRRPWALNFYMSVPYLFVRPSIRNERHQERTPQGAERVYPVPVPPLEPVYL